MELEHSEEEHIVEDLEECQSQFYVSEKSEENSIMYPPTVKWLLYPDDEEEQEKEGKFHLKGLSLVFVVEDQKKDTVRFIDLTVEEQEDDMIQESHNPVKRILKKRNLQERENAELSDDDSYENKRQMLNHCFVPNVSTESIKAKPIAKSRSHETPIETYRKKAISDFVVKSSEPSSEGSEGATAAATLFMECPRKLFNTSTNKQQEFQKIIKKKK